MPNSRSALKRIRSDAKRRENNQKVLSELKTVTKKLRRLVETDKKQAAEYSRLVGKKWDKAASNNVVPKKRASRQKSRIARLVTQA